MPKLHELTFSEVPGEFANSQGYLDTYYSHDLFEDHELDEYYGVHPRWETIKKLPPRLFFFNPSHVDDEVLENFKASSKGSINLGCSASNLNGEKPDNEEGLIDHQIYQVFQFSADNPRVSI
jgi:hypothetical protein